MPPLRRAVGQEFLHDLGVRSRQDERASCLTFHFLRFRSKAMPLKSKIAFDFARSRRAEAPFCGAFRLHFGHFFILILEFSNS